MPAVLPPSSSPSRRLTITLTPSTYSRVVDMGEVDDWPVARRRGCTNVREVAWPITDRSS